MLFIFRRKRVLIDLNGQALHQVHKRYTFRLCFIVSFGNAFLWIKTVLKRDTMKNSIHYSKQNIAKAFRVIAALVSLGQQTSHSCNRSVSPLVM